MHELKAEDRRGITLREVADAAGVSRATVSLVLRDSPLVALSTRERVKTAIASIGYVYNRGAARLRTGSSGTIGLIVPEITNPFYAELTAGIDDTFDAVGRLTFLANSNDRPERQERFIRLIKEHGVDGMIVCAAEGSAASPLLGLQGWGMPFVQILRSIDGMAGDFVAPDFRRGTEIAVDHLVGRGHRAIALLPSQRKTSAARERTEAFGAALGRHDLGPGAVIPCGADRISAAEALGALLDRPVPPTAVICHNDLMALGIMGALRARGMVPGRDLGIVGFDDIPEASNVAPALTSVATGAVDVGVVAAKLLLRRIAAPAGAPERILIRPTLKVRDT